MTNPSMPGLVKIGRSSRTPEMRAEDDDLNSTGIPTKFKVEYYAFFDDMYKGESLAHRGLSRFRAGKEFFKVDIYTAINAIENTGLNFTKLFPKPNHGLKANEIKETRKFEEQKEKINKQKEHTLQTSSKNKEEKTNPIDISLFDDLKYKLLAALYVIVGFLILILIVFIYGFLDNFFN